MSRIGNKVIVVPAGVTVDIKEGNFLTVKGPKGQLEKQLNSDLSITLDGNLLTVKRPNNEMFMRKIHGTTRALLFNMVHGVSEGFSKKLEIKGVGYRAQLQGNTLVLQLGFSHNIEMPLPEGISLDVPKNTEITVNGIDKAVVGQFAAEIRKHRKPEPYKGKGIRYVDEYVARKAGKTAK
ncbi:50S ribosomal protein L6 [Acholeplasma laidlawii]|uniref:50S ribosomal protein L6 n=1 Tax=Acholeplasma laidlawii TaxID=2148 RepID=UPI0018C2A10F|nr:50S ribosomal protein L6 [Acholeplasma laidlawii]MBG0762865.1 50S ribosomal protein L6 [Acholeplasma laidlawii]WIF88572.1 50S ribosomal protein L6 [Acholeplasma laidlawii]